MRWILTWSNMIRGWFTQETWLFSSASHGYQSVKLIGLAWTGYELPLIIAISQNIPMILRISSSRGLSRHDKQWIYCGKFLMKLGFNMFIAGKIIELLLWDFLFLPSLTQKCIRSFQMRIPYETFEWSHPIFLFELIFEFFVLYGVHNGLGLPSGKLT